MRLRAGGLPVLAALFLAGCAMRPMQPDLGIDWDQRAGLLAAEEAWRARGRIAFKSGAEGGQGSLLWRQAESATRISLSGPFGAGAYEIEWDEQRIAVNSKKGERIASYTGRDAADRFLERELGWSFPARSIRYWLLGIADPQYDSERRFDDAGWLAGLEQNGWSVEYSRFSRVGAYYMPGKIVMEHEQARVKLVIDDWSI